MKIVLVTGGARAGKSRWVEGEAARMAGDAVTYIATAEVRDAEMARRIARHRSERPASWHTVEEPLDVPRAVALAPHDTVVLDCLTVWVSNLMLQEQAEASEGDQTVSLGTEVDAGIRVHEATDRLLRAAGKRRGSLLIVTNEVGMGIVPENDLARAYRDLLGRANARFAAEAHQVVLMVAGLPLRVR